MTWFDNVSQRLNAIDYNTRRRIKKGALYITLIAWVVIATGPIYWMISSSIRPVGDLRTPDPQLLPSLGSITFENWSIIAAANVSQLIFNTIIVATGVISLTVSISTIAGYGLTRYDFPFRITFARLILMGYMISPIALAIPLYQIYNTLDLLNSYLGLIIAQATIATPFAVWLMWNMFQTISKSKEEAAWIYGASRWRAFKDIAVPTVLPGIFAVAIFGFAVVWNDFTYTKILAPQREAMTLSPGILVLAQQGQYIHPGFLMAIATLMTAIPIVIAYWLQGYILEGFRIGR